MSLREKDLCNCDQALQYKKALEDVKKLICEFEKYSFEGTAGSDVWCFMGDAIAVTNKGLLEQK